MMGERQRDQGSLFYRFSLERHVPAEHLLRGDRPFRRSRRSAGALSSVLQFDGPAIDRPRAAHPYAAHWVLPRHPLGTTVVRGSPPQPGLSLALPGD